MATTSNVPITAGSGTDIATFSITEDTVTKYLQRIALTDSTGTEVPVKQANTPAAAIDPAFVVTISPNGQNPDGAATSANSTSVVQATDDVVLGPVTETPPATDTASSGLNGRLQRIAQRLTTLIGSTIATQPVRSATGTQTSVASSATSVTVLASNANRLSGSIFNESTQVLYVLFHTGGTAVISGGNGTNGNYSVQIGPSAYYDNFPAGYTGDVIGIWASANGFARVTEFT